MFQAEELAEVDISTHAASPKLLLRQLASETGAGLYLLGVQPKHHALGQGLSVECQSAAEKISQALIELSGGRLSQT